MTEGFKVIPVGKLAVNSTILYSQGEAFIFDPGADSDKLVQFLEENNLSLKGIFLTHGHIDHFGHVKPLKEKFPDVPVYMNEKDNFLLKEELWPGFAQYLGAYLNPPIDSHLKEGDIFSLGNLSVEVYETPGHTPGSVVFYIPQLRLLIAGDLLFKGGIGRYDLPGGSWEDLKHSLKRVFSLFPETTTVITGHYDLTNLGYEKKNNPYLREIL
jgi:glyoxylase-like metal-dependent hydrolase (beta-lactamase superfamily II)